MGSHHQIHLVRAGQGPQALEGGSRDLDGLLGQQLVQGLRPFMAPDRRFRRLVQPYRVTRQPGFRERDDPGAALGGFGDQGLGPVKASQQVQEYRRMLDHSRTDDGMVASFHGEHSSWMEPRRAPGSISLYPWCPGTGDQPDPSFADARARTGSEVCASTPQAA